MSGTSSEPCCPHRPGRRGEPEAVRKGAGPSQVILIKTRRNIQPRPRECARHLHRSTVTSAAPRLHYLRSLWTMRCSRHALRRRGRREQSKLRGDSAVSRRSTRGRSAPRTRAAAGALLSHPHSPRERNRPPGRGRKVFAPKRAKRPTAKKKAIRKPAPAKGKTAKKKATKRTVA
ncbi:MAG: hypothetical protein JWQ49_2784 [Edaphobacter sp.]|nr:hypothetical protein [Edaphobacter sp.]